MKDKGLNMKNVHLEEYKGGGHDTQGIRMKLVKRDPEKMGQLCVEVRMGIGFLRDLFWE